MTFWALIAVYAAARVLQVYRGGIPMLAVVALHVLPPLVFALIHGARSYGWRGILTFVSICVVAGNIFENLGVRTGFPYGSYYFTGLMGPKIFAVPVLLGLAYVGMAYLSWTLARLILGVRIVATPLVAACIMVAWDLAMDPVWSTVMRAWVFPHAGPYFGVPLSNFLGWYLAVYTIYQAFALYLSWRPAGAAQLPAGYWRQALLFYAVSAAGNLVLLMPQAGPSMVADPTGVEWRVSEITSVCALVTILTMGAFTLLAWVRMARQTS